MSSLAMALAVACLLPCTCAASAQAGKPVKKKEVRKEIDFSQRWAFKTNVVDWALTMPNVQVAFDLSPSIYNRNVIQIGAKYNWSTYHKYAPYFVFDIFEVRSEFRHYFRFREPPKDYKGGRVAQFFSPYRKNPKTWQAYYLGFYAGYTEYSFKPGKIGRQGSAVGFGVSFGRETPLYSFDKGVIDFELGISAGFVFTRYDGYQLDRNTYSYVLDPAHTHSWHLKLCPVVSEIRAAFSWRRLSVKDKFRETDNAKEQFKMYMKETSRGEMYGLRESIPRRAEWSDKEYIQAFKDSIGVDYRRHCETIDMHPSMTDAQKDKLKDRLLKIVKKHERAFRSAVRKASASAAKTQKTKEEQAGKQEKPGKEKAVKPKKAKQEKVKDEPVE